MDKKIRYEVKRTQCRRSSFRNYRSCYDQLLILSSRNKAYDGMCRTTVIPTVNQLKEQQPVDILLGDSITLSAG